MLFARRGMVATVLVLVSALPWDGVVAQERDEGWLFIPAQDEPCGDSCSDPDAPLSRVNYPPRDDNFEEMFVPAESGLKVVRNPHWNGTEAPGDWCGPQCLDPYAPADLENPLRRNDAQELMLVFVRDGNDVYIRARPNPSWVGREAVEAMEAIGVSAPLPLLGLGVLSGDVDFDAEDPDSAILSRSLDRTGVPYHAAGNDVFQPEVLQSVGGVLSQGAAGGGRGDGAPLVQFAFGRDGGYPGFVFVSDRAAIGRYYLRYEDLVPMALFVDGGGTSLYTLWGANRLPANFRRDAGFAKYEGGSGHVAIEFAGTWYADALYFLDICTGCTAAADDDSQAAVDVGSAVAAQSSGERSSSYINTDVGSVFEVEKADRGRIKVRADISRFHWSTDSSGSGELSVDRKQRIVRPDALRANVDRLLKEAFQSKESRAALFFLRMRGIDVKRRLRKEAGMVGRRRLADVFFLFETLALLRTTKRHAPTDWSAFMAALSSDWLVRRNREPWARYTETFCGVYTRAPECSGFDPGQ